MLQSEQLCCKGLEAEHMVVMLEVQQMFNSETHKMQAFVWWCCLFQHTDAHHEQQQTQHGHSVETRPGSCRSRMSSFLNLLEESRTDWSCLAPRRSVFWLSRVIVEVDHLFWISLLFSRLSTLLDRYYTPIVSSRSHSTPDTSHAQWRTSNRNRRLTPRPAWGLPRVQSQPYAGRWNEMKWDELWQLWLPYVAMLHSWHHQQIPLDLPVYKWEDQIPRPTFSPFVLKLLHAILYSYMSTQPKGVSRGTSDFPPFQGPPLARCFVIRTQPLLRSAGWPQWRGGLFGLRK